jgi:hypothetical protein
MRVVIFAQDLSSRNDDGYYTKPDISSALDIFFPSGQADAFLDADGENALSRNDAEAIFQQDKKVIFYNEAGEKVVISQDPSK